MTLKIKDELIALNVITVLVFLIINFLPDNPVRIVAGLPFVLFIPGYALISALHPRKSSLTGMERVMWGFGLSLAVVPLLGLLLNVTFGITLYPVAGILGGFIFIMSVIAWVRRHRLPEQERFSLTLDLRFPWREVPVIDRVLYIFLAVAILGAIGTACYKLVEPKEQDMLTEFYLLNSEGQASNYPDVIEAGKETGVIAAIGNHEEQPITYRIEVKIGDEVYTRITDIELADGETMKIPVAFTAGRTDEKVKVEFFLFEGDSEEPYLTPLYLWVDVVESVP